MKNVFLSLAALLATAFLLGCGGDSDSDEPNTFDDDAYPFTFEYPGDWSETDDVTLDQQLGNSGEDTRAVGIDETNGIILQTFQLAIEVDDGNIDAAQKELDGLIAQVDSDATSTVGDTAGLPSVTFDSVSVPQPEGAESKLFAIFDGDKEYMINCQSTEGHRDEVAEGCDQALETLETR